MGINSALGSSALLPAGLGFRNVIINGGFDVWQRGTSAAFTASASSSFLADRWSVYRGTTGADATQSRISAGLDGFQYALRMQRNSGTTGTNKMYIGTSLETSTATKLANKPVVLSFYARAGANYSSASNVLEVLLSSGTGTEANGVHVNFTGSTSVINTNATLTTSYQRFTYYGVMPATSSQLLVQLSFTPSGTAGAADYVDITGVQLEQNYQPTPFEQRPIGTELSLCQRYYWRTYGSGTLSDLFGSGIPNNTTTAYIGVPHPVEMRIAATSLDFNAQVTDLNNDWNTTGSSIYSGNKRSTTVRVTEGAYFTAFRPIFVNLNTTSRYIGLSAEL